MVDGPIDVSTPRALTYSQAAQAFERLDSLETEEQPAPAEASADETPEEESTAPDESPTEQEGDEGEEPDDDESPDEEPSQPKTRRLKIGDDEVEVTDEELEKGYLRQSDYTRKTQEAAETRKRAEAAEAQHRAAVEQYAARVAHLHEALTSLQPAEPDWDKLRQENPTEFAAQWAEWEQYRRKVEAVAVERHRAETEAQTAQQAELARIVEGEKAKLVEKIPAWKDAAVAKKEKSELVDYAKSFGYSDEDLGQVTDHRVLVMLRNSMLHERAEKLAAEKKPIVQGKIERAIKPAAPGNPAAKKTVSELTRDKQRLAKTGRIRDAAAVFEKAGF